MKKSLLIAALAVFTMASCSKDEVVNVPQNEIRFAVVTENATKAEQIYCANNMMDNFKIFASYKADGGTTYAPYITEKDVTVNDDKTCTFTNGTHYWPDGGSLDFFAFVNADAQNGDDIINWSAYDANENKAQIKFTVAADPINQKDLIYAVAPNKTKSANANGVALNFRHALSQIEFRAKNLNENIYVVIDGVKVCNLEGGTQTYTLPVEDTKDQIIDHDQDGKEDNPADPDNVADLQYYANTRGTWVTPATPSYNDYVISFEEKKLAGDNEATAIELTPYTDNQEYSANSMLLMPQKRDAWVPTDADCAKPDSDANTKVYFAVKCRIYNVAGTEYDENTDIMLWGATDGSKQVSKYAAIPVEINWMEGKKYIYTFVFDKDGNGGYNPDPEDPSEPEPVLTPIKLTVSVDDFTMQTETELDMETKNN